MNTTLAVPLRRYVCIVMCLFVLNGCGGGGPKMYPVKGKVTHKNQPLQGAGITFHPSSDKVGNIAIGQTNAQGEFELMTFNPGDGAIAGAYLVTVTKIEGGGLQAPQISPSKATTPEAMMKEMMAGSEKQASGMQKQAMSGRTPASITTIKQLLPVKYAKKESSPLKATVSDSENNEFTFTVED